MLAFLAYNVFSFFPDHIRTTTSTTVVVLAAPAYYHYTETVGIDADVSLFGEALESLGLLDPVTSPAAAEVG